MARRKTAPKKKADEPPYVRSHFLYRVPFVARDRFTVREGRMMLVHPAALSTESAELVVEWLELVIKKIRQMTSDEVATCSGCEKPAVLWDRSELLVGFCKECAPTPHHVMGDDFEKLIQH